MGLIGGESEGIMGGHEPLFGHERMFRPEDAKKVVKNVIEDQAEQPDDQPETS